MARLSRKATVGIGLLLVLFGVLVLVRTFTELSAGVYMLAGAAALFYAFFVWRRTPILFLAWLATGLGVMLVFGQALGGRYSASLPTVFWLSMAISALGLHLTGHRRLGNWPLIVGAIFLLNGVFSTLGAIPELRDWFRRYGVYAIPAISILAGLAFLALGMRQMVRERRMAREMAWGMDAKAEGAGESAGAKGDAGAGDAYGADAVSDGQMRMDLEAAEGAGAKGDADAKGDSDADAKGGIGADAKGESGADAKGDSGVDAMGVTGAGDASVAESGAGDDPSGESLADVAAESNAGDDASDDRPGDAAGEDGAPTDDDAPGSKADA